MMKKKKTKKDNNIDIDNNLTVSIENSELNA